MPRTHSQEAPNLPEWKVGKRPHLKPYIHILPQECLRCHTGGKGRSRRGDYRGVGCASCHIPYSNEGFYEGNDSSIPKDKRGHLLTHQIQSSRKVNVSIHDINYSGIPVETCTTCHNRGKRIGVSYQGLMETEYQSTFDSEGNSQPKLQPNGIYTSQRIFTYSKGECCVKIATHLTICTAMDLWLGANLGCLVGRLRCSKDWSTGTDPKELPPLGKFGPLGELTPGTERFSGYWIGLTQVGKKGRRGEPTPKTF